eukprot:comp24921_c0_seq1/m.46913 comp24921_c0_seq1/g.46913  ORF comp24921_c0_seq1/g.46913 comp24921_c0_seq1/m.46913 type:complete len:482 (-) comp24921_c0_seq1:315-1760(-)
MATALVNKIDRSYISSHVELVRLLRKGEGINDLLGWNGHQILMRWVNHHLYRGKHETRIANFGEDLKDGTVYVKVLKQILPKQTEGIDDVLSTESLEERASKLVEWAGKVNVKTAGISATDMAAAKEDANTAFVAALFFEHPSIRLPGEAEITTLFSQLDGLRVKLRDCEEHRAILKTKIGYLEADIAELKKRKAMLEASISSKSNELAAKTSEYDQLVVSKASEIADLTAAIAAKEKELAAKISEMTAAQQEKEKMEEEKAKIISENKDTIFNLEGSIANLNSANDQLKQLIHGKGSDLGQMEADLKMTEEAAAQKAKNIAEYLAKSSEVLAKAAKEVKAESVLPTPCEDELESLKNNLDAQTQLLKKFEEALNAKRTEFTRHKAEEKKRIDDLNRSVADYLGEGQANAEDAIANIKRLLELMIEKCKKQAQQIQTLEVTIDKKNQINDVMAEKIRKIAEESMKPAERGKLGRKKPSFRS